jgi:DNA topoisomerase III
LTIDGASPVILYLMDNGTLTEVPVPTGGDRRPARSGGGKGGGRSSRRWKGSASRSDTGSGRSEEAGTEKGTSRRKGTGSRGRRGKASPSDDRPAPAEGEAPEAPPTPPDQANGFSSVALGRCPSCGSDVVDQPKSYGCTGWKQGCKFAIWKTIAGKKISVRTAEALLKSGQSPLLRGFQSKAGKEFEARLKLDGGEVRFDFSGGDRRRIPPKSPDTT